MDKVRVGKYSMDSDEWTMVSSEAKMMISRMLQKGTVV
jgi:hypothetical protein